MYIAVFSFDYNEEYHLAIFSLELPLNKVASNILLKVTSLKLLMILAFHPFQYIHFSSIS